MKLKHWLIIAAIIGVAIFILKPFGITEKAKKGVDTGHNWRRTFEVSPNYEPYETALLYNTLDETYGSYLKNISDDLDLEGILSRAPEKSLYMAIGQQMKLDSAELEALFEFANSGNDVLLSCEWIYNKGLRKILFAPILDEREEIRQAAEARRRYSEEVWEDKWTWSDEQERWIRIDNPFKDTMWSDYYSKSAGQKIHQQKGWTSGNYGITLSISADSVFGFLCGKEDSTTLAPRTFKGRPWFKEWDYYNPKFIEKVSSQFEDIKPVAYIRNNDERSTCHVTALEIKHGDGRIFLIANPLVFTNFFMRDSAHFFYVNHLLDEPQAQTIYWDDMSRVHHKTRAYQNSDSYFRFILSNSALSKAFYFTLLAILFFLLISIKRRQRSIPILDQNENTSLAYSHSIARLYYLNPNHKLMLNKRRLHFQNFVANRYGLKFAEDEEFRSRLAERSGVDLRYIDKLFNSYELADGQSVVQEYLLKQVANLQEYFYLNCK